jgi:hypothetical protein
MAANFIAAQGWETLDEAGRKPLRNLIVELVGYPCKLACQPNNGAVDIYVLNDKKKRVCDWLEIQPSGAIGVIWDEYPDSNAKAVARLSDACDEYNERIGVCFESDSEGEESGEEGGSESSESAAPGGEEDDGL